MEFFQVDVFADRPYHGNPLAVFPDGGELTRGQMQAIASEMNLSETTFVSSAQSDSYEVRIFTPEEELPFAGHPTIGSAWLLRHLGIVKSDDIVQRSAAGATPVSVAGDLIWLQRGGTTEADLDERDIRASDKLARALGLASGDVGVEARELGRSGRLRPAFADAGVRELMVPIRDLDALARCHPRWHLLDEISTVGAYCYTPLGAGRVQARGFFPALGIPEDPATGAAAAALGVYLAARLGPIDIEIMQGVEMGRPSHIYLKAERETVRVGGRCALILRGELEVVPS